MKTKYSFFSRSEVLLPFRDILHIPKWQLHLSDWQEASFDMHLCILYKNKLHVDSRVFTRMLRKDGRTEGRTVALLYPFATSLARG
jgi:hypothetical protein